MPLANQQHVDKLLSQISVKYRNTEYIADQVFPTLPVKKESDLYRVYIRNFRIPETKRANKAESREHHFEVTTATYHLQKNSLKDYISDDDIENYDMASLRADTTEELTDVILRRREKDVADLFTTTSWSQNVSLAAANAWNANTTISNPIPIVDTGTTEIIQNSGFRPNFGILPRDGFVAVKAHISILDRVKYTSAEMTETMVARLFDLETLLTPIASFDSSELGTTEAITQMWGDVMFIGYKPPRPSPLSPSSGYIFQRPKQLVKRWRVEGRDSEAVEVNMQYQAKVVASLSGFLIKDIV